MSFKYMSIEISSYRRFKESLDIALTGAADHMVHVGYLLMQARDTDILRESGYTGMGEFAQKEYNLSPDQTSRFIAIAERFGDGEGRLRDEWQQYGYTKLSEMLTLPDAVVSAIPPEITRDEIRELKEEVKAEQRITPIEVAIENAETGAEEKPLLYQFFKEYFRPVEHAEEFARICDEHKPGEEPKRAVLDALAPSGISILEARVPGKGRFLLSFKGEDVSPAFVDIRGNQSQDMEWKAIYEELYVIAFLGEKRGKAKWEELYGEPFPEKKKEEPAQTVTSTPAKPERKPEKKVKIAPAQKKPEKKESKKGEPEKAEETEKAEAAAAPTACQPAEPVDVWTDETMNKPVAPEEEQRPANEVLDELHQRGKLKNLYMLSWIPAEDPPKEEGTYLVTCRHKGNAKYLPCEGNLYEQHDGYYLEMDLCSFGYEIGVEGLHWRMLLHGMKVIAWMPLPTHYHESEGTNE